MSLKILGFITYIINDISLLYFDNLSGVRLEPLLEFVELSEANMADTEILLYHCQLVASVCYCLYEHEPKNEDEKQVFLLDVRQVTKSILGCIRNLISGKVNSQYKANYEKQCQLLAECAFRVIHLGVQRFTVV